MRSNFKKILALLACLCLLLPTTVFTSMANTSSATVDFTDIANRVSYSPEEQVWQQNGITITNNKGASTSNVGDYGGNGYPARFYKSSTLTIAYPGMTKIEINVSGLDSKYVTAWTDSFAAMGLTAANDGTIVSVELGEAVDSLTIETMAAQGRANNITVYSEGGSDIPDEPDTPDAPVFIDNPYDPLDSWDLVSERTVDALERFGSHHEMAGKSVAMRAPNALVNNMESSFTYKNDGHIATAISVSAVVMDGWTFDLAVSGRAADGEWIALDYVTSAIVDIPGASNPSFKQGVATVTVPENIAEVKIALVNTGAAWTFAIDYVDIQWEATTPDTPVNDTLTIPQANEMGVAVGNNAYTTDKYSVSGKIVEYYTNYATYGNVYIEDAEGNRFLVYGLYSADGTVRYDAMDVKPVIGDTITVYGIIGNYNGNPQMKNGWLTAYEAGTGDTPDQPDTPDTPDQPAGEPTVVTNPVTGKAYKFGMIQGNVSDTDVYYLKGGMNGYYMDTNTGWDNAIDVYLEETDGGYYFYTMDEAGVKLYINMVVSGTHVNGAYEATASTVYTYDADAQTLIAVVNDADYWFGTRNDKTYTTVGPVAVAYAGFYCKLYEIPTPDEPIEGGLVENPVAGTAYKFGMIQGNVSDTDVYYLKGGMDGYYMATDKDVANAIDVYLEETDGGYYFYTMDEAGVKLYINMVVSGTHVNGAYEASPSTVYTYNAESKTITAVVNDADYWFGTRNDKTYTTVGPVAVAYNGFYCQFYTEGTGGSTPDTPDTPDIPDEPVVGGVVENPVAGTAYKLGLENSGIYYFTGTMSSYYGATSTDVGSAVDVYLEETDGGYYLYFDNGSKQYINLVQSGTHYNFTFGTEASSVFTLDAEKNALCTAVGDEICYMGNYGTYSSMSVLRTSKLNETDHIARLYSAEGGDQPGGDDPVVPPTNDPDPDTELSIPAANELGLSKPLNTYTAGKYYVTGKISAIDYSSVYGNMSIVDDAGNSLYIYGTYSADGALKFGEMAEADKPAEGDTITVYGIIGTYNGNEAQMKNGWITNVVKGDGPANSDPAPDTELTIKEAIALGQTKAHNFFTAGKYYVTGKITEVYNDIYGNMYITDDEGNTLTIYGTYSTDGALKYGEMDESARPVAGDTVKLYGIIGQYNGTSQMKNGWIIEINGEDAPEAPDDDRVDDPDREDPGLEDDRDQIPQDPTTPEDDTDKNEDNAPEDDTDEDNTNEDNSAEDEDATPEDDTDEDENNAPEDDSDDAVVPEDDSDDDYYGDNSYNDYFPNDDTATDDTIEDDTVVDEGPVEIPEIPGTDNGGDANTNNDQQVNADKRDATPLLIVGGSMMLIVLAGGAAIILILLKKKKTTPEA